MKMVAFVNRGPRVGDILRPHLDKNCYFYAQGLNKVTFKFDKLKVKTLKELEEYVEKGYSIRMSSSNRRISASLIQAKSIQFWTSKEDRKNFESWLLKEQWLNGEWDDERNSYKEFPCHLAFRAWEAGRELLVKELNKEI